jgi:hypothetical protein
MCCDLLLPEILKLSLGRRMVRKHVEFKWLLLTSIGSVLQPHILGGSKRQRSLG